jgi:hypothetical protein
MAYFTSELAQAPPVTVSGVAIAQRVGCGYPTGDATKATYWPTTIALGTTTNPAGNANSPGETGAVAGFPYGYKTWEQKAAAMVPPGVFAVVVN